MTTLTEMIFEALSAERITMNTLICTKCKRLWVPGTAGPCPKCGGGLKEIVVAQEKDTPDEIRFTFMDRKMVTQEKTS